MNLTAKNIDYDLKEKAKEIVKESGFAWEYYITKAVEKVLAETVEDGNVERFILRGGKK
jgi:hypothetical protein